MTDWLPRRGWWPAFTSDVKHSVRLLHRAPLRSAVIVACIALGAGLDAGMFGIVDDLLLQPPAHVRDWQRLAYLRPIRVLRGGGSADGASFTDYQSLAADSRVFDHVVAQAERELPVTTASREESLVATFTTSGVFRMTDGGLLAGAYPTSESAWETDAGAVLTADAATRLFEDHAALGRTIRVGGVNYTIVAVVAADFRGTSRRRTDVWLPLASAGADLFGPAWQANPSATFLELVVHVPKSVAKAAAAARAFDMLRVSQTATFGRLASVQLTSVMDPVIRLGSRGSFVPLILAALSLAVFGVAVGNVVLLAWVEQSARRSEFASRLALGASPLALARLSMTRLVPLLAVGGALGVWIAWMVGMAAVRLAWTREAMTGRVVALAFVFAVTAAAVTAVAVLQGLPRSIDALELAARGNRHPRATTLARLLMVGQSAFSFALTVVAVLFAVSLNHLLTARVGFDAPHVLAIDVVGGMSFPNAGALEAVLTEVRDRVTGLPVVRGATVSMAHPYGATPLAQLRQLPEDQAGTDPQPLVLNAVEPNFFEVTGAKVTVGRGFQSSDLRGSTPVALVDSAFVRRFSTELPALSSCVSIDAARHGCVRIVGVVGNLIQHDVLEPPRPSIYLPMAQFDGRVPIRTLLVRTIDPAIDAVPAIRASAKAVAPDVDLLITPLAEPIRAQLRPWVRASTMTALFGALSIVLGLFGSFAVTAARVAARRPEIGIRLALGATPSMIAAFVRKEVVIATAVGCVVGMAAVLFLIRAMEPMLVDAGGWPVRACAIATVVLSAFAYATVTPLARAAARTNPTILLK